MNQIKEQRLKKLWSEAKELHIQRDDINKQLVLICQKLNAVYKKIEKLNKDTP